MHVVEELLAQRGRQTSIAREMRCPSKTVHSWATKRHIPEWRRSAVLGAVRRLDITISSEALQYLVVGE